MNSSTRVAVNTSIQYVRTFITVIITLYTSRVILANLGVEDYGIYSLIGGVITMLAFIQNNLARTTQRYLSYYQGKGDFQYVTKIFNNSVCTQIAVAVFLCGILALLTNPVILHLVNIPANKIEAAKWVYWLMLVSLFINLQSAPYLAALIARENMVFSSIVQILDAILKIPVALSLIWISENKLEWYSFMSLLIVALNFICYYIFCIRKYDECRYFTLRSFDIKLSKEMLSFMGWNVYGTVCIMGRTQGTAILLNRFFGPSINAAFGIGGQVSGQMGFLSNALTTAINPQIIKAEGGGNRKKMLRLCEISCKFSFLLMSMVSVPAVIYMPTILNIWLEEVPQHTSMFCIFILIANQIDLLTLTLNTANQAIGNVKTYNICVNTIKALTLVFIYFALKQDTHPAMAMIVYVIFEAICASARLIFLKINVQMSVSQYLNNVFFSIIPPLAINIAVCYLISPWFPSWGGLVVGCISIAITGLTTYLFGLKIDEREIINAMAVKIIKRIKR